MHTILTSLSQMSRYERYFNGLQTGGKADFGDLHRTSFFIQRGRGLSDAFGAIIKWITPLLLSSSKAIGREALRSGSEVLSNIGSKPIKELLKEQAGKSLKNLTDKAAENLKRMNSEKQQGGSIKRVKKRSTTVIKASSRLSSTRSHKRKKKTVKRKRKTKSKKKKSSPKTGKIKGYKNKKDFLKQYLG